MPSDKKTRSDISRVFNELKRCVNDGSTYLDHYLRLVEDYVMKKQSVPVFKIMKDSGELLDKNQAYTCRWDYGLEIFYSSAKDSTATHKRCCIAHELGHFMLMHGGDHDSRQESEAWYFAKLILGDSYDEHKSSDYLDSHNMDMNAIMDAIKELYPELHPDLT